MCIPELIALIVGLVLTWFGVDGYLAPQGAVSDIVLYTIGSGLTLWGGGMLIIPYIGIITTGTGGRYDNVR